MQESKEKTLRAERESNSMSVSKNSEISRRSLRYKMV